MAAVETNNQLTDNFLSIQNAKPDDKKNSLQVFLLFKPMKNQEKWALICQTKTKLWQLDTEIVQQDE